MPSSLLSFLCPEDLLCQHINNDWSLPSAMLTFSSYFFFLNLYFWTRHPKMPNIIKNVQKNSWWSLAKCYVDLLFSLLFLNFYTPAFFIVLAQVLKPNLPRCQTSLKDTLIFYDHLHLNYWWSIAKPENNNCSKAFLEAVLETQHEPVANSRRAHHPSPRILREQLIQVKKIVVGQLIQDRDSKDLASRC